MIRHNADAGRPNKQAMCAKRSTDGPSACLRVKDVAKLLRISIRTLWRWRHDGKMPRPLKIGRVVRWRRHELDAWLAAGGPTLECDDADSDPLADAGLSRSRP